MFPDYFLVYQRGDKGALIPLLQDLQESEGYVSEEGMKQISRYTGVVLSRVYGVATFYNQFRLKPLGKHIIKVCRGTACHVKNSGALLYALELQLGIQSGGTTRDRNFSIEVVNCIGACSIAPLITVDEEFYGRIAVKDIASIVRKYQPKKTVKPTVVEEGVTV